VSDPVLLYSIRPRYTEQAMRARLQGVVALDAVILPDGLVGTVRIVRSLDRTFGLDQNAIEAVQAWRFKPGLLAGQPVAVLVRIELTFSLR
jgi:periplasmic protein TonB